MDTDPKPAFLFKANLWLFHAWSPTMTKRAMPFPHAPEPKSTINWSGKCFAGTSRVKLSLLKTYLSMVSSPPCHGGRLHLPRKWLFFVMVRVNLRPLAELFRAHVLKMLKQEGLIDDEVVKTSLYVVVRSF
jgi:hypothetical protein